MANSPQNLAEPDVPAGVFRGFMTRMNSLLSRSSLASGLGIQFGGARDLYATFGWDRVITQDAIWNMYQRGGVARRIAHALPKAVWGRPPQLYIEGNDTWNAWWKTFSRTIGLWEALYRADVLATLGAYSIVVIGTDRPNLAAPLTNAKEITFLQPYSDRNARVSQWNNDPTSRSFGQPLMYTIYPSGVPGSSQASLPGGATMTTAPVQSSYTVHASRVLHLVRDPLENKVYGVPVFVPIWNYLNDLIKVVGSSAESYWMTANRGLHADVDMDMDLDPGDEANLSAEVDDYQHGLRRFIRTRGVKVSSLGAETADPKGAFTVLMTLIAGTLGIPQRILLGSEAGQLASGQDRGNWAERVEEDRGVYATPNVVVPFLHKLQDMGLLDTAIDPTSVQILWPDAYRMSPVEKAQQANVTARSVAQLAKATATTQAPSIADPTHVSDPLSPTPPPMIPDPNFVPDEALITRDEARAIIGLSTDNKILLESPS